MKPNDSSCTKSLHENDVSCMKRTLPRARHDLRSFTHPQASAVYIHSFSQLVITSGSASTAHMTRNPFGEPLANMHPGAARAGAPADDARVPQGALSSTLENTLKEIGERVRNPQRYHLDWTWGQYRWLLDHYKELGREDTDGLPNGSAGASQGNCPTGTEGRKAQGGMETSRRPRPGRSAEVRKLRRATRGTTI